ncbi:MAG: winged helix-turn-helix domain-containing protein [Acidimicrobiales bacterium]
MKPFSPRELVLRSHAILRRARDDRPLASEVTSFGDGTLELDAERRQVHVRRTVVALTPTEWSILGALASRPGRVYSRAELGNRARGYGYDTYERTIDSHVRNLRRKVEAEPRSPEIVLTVLGGGYRLGLARDPA